MSNSPLNAGFNKASITNLNLGGSFPTGSEVTLPLPTGSVPAGNLNITLWAMSPAGRVRAGVYNSNATVSSNPVNISGIPAPMLQFNGAINVGSYTITNVSSFIGLSVGQVLNAIGIPEGTVILRFDPINRIITMSNTATQTMSYQAIATDGTNYTFEMEAIYQPYGQPPTAPFWSAPFAPAPVTAPKLTFNSQATTSLQLGVNFPSGAQVTFVDPPQSIAGNIQITLWLLNSTGQLERIGWYSNMGATTNPIDLSRMSVPCLQLNGKMTKGSKTLTNVSSFLGIAVGQTLTAYGFPAGTTIVSFDPIHRTITTNNAATEDIQYQVMNTNCIHDSLFLKAVYSNNSGGAGVTGWSNQFASA